MRLSSIMNSMVRFSLLLFFLCTFLVAEDSNTTKELMIIKDHSGLSDSAVRQKAEDLEKKQKKLHLKDVVDSIEEDGQVNLTKIAQKSWEELSPTPKDGFDWIKLKHGDWLKGHLRSWYDDEIEFETKEFGFHTFNLKDIEQVKSFDRLRINIDNVAIFKGLVRYKDPTITIITGDGSYKFNKNMIIAITSGKDKEVYNWAGDIAFDADVRSGNSDKADYSLKISLQRRTPKNRLMFDYFGRYSESNDEKTAQDSRYNLKYDRFFTKKFFITPLFGEYYENYFQNIKAQVTLGGGLGYSIFNELSILEWDVSAGPAYLMTRHYEDVDGVFREEGYSFEITSRFEYKINRITKIKLDYNFTFTKKELGKYKHHTITKIENDIIKDRVFIDISFIWDYTESPQITQNYTPQKNDYQTLVGGGVKF